MSYFYTEGDIVTYQNNTIIYMWDRKGRNQKNREPENWRKNLGFTSKFGSPGRTRTKRIVRQNVDKQIGGVYFLVEDPSERIDYAG